MSLRRCAAEATKGSPHSKGSWPSLFDGHDGRWYCLAHLPPEAKHRGRATCTHALGFGLGSCPLCGEPQP